MTRSDLRNYVKTMLSGVKESNGLDLFLLEGTEFLNSKVCLSTPYETKNPMLLSFLEAWRFIEDTKEYEATDNEKFEIALDDMTDLIHLRLKRVSA